MGLSPSRASHKTEKKIVEIAQKSQGGRGGPRFQKRGRKSYERAGTRRATKKTKSKSPLK